MGVPRGRRTKSKQGGRRSHLALSALSLRPCSQCGSSKAPHRACPNCGTYKGRPVVDVFKKLSKRERKAKEETLAEQQTETAKAQT